MEYQNMYKVISKPWLDTNDIKKICSCSTSSALLIRQEIEEKVLEMGKHLPISNRKVVPTAVALDYLGIDINYVYNMTLKELELQKFGDLNEC